MTGCSLGVNVAEGTFLGPWISTRAGNIILYTIANSEIGKTFSKLFQTFPNFSKLFQKIGNFQFFQKFGKKVWKKMVVSLVFDIVPDIE